MYSLLQEALRSINQLQSLLAMMAARRMYHVMVVQPVPSHWEQLAGGTTPYAYTWTTSDGTIPAGQQNNANLTGLTAGTYNYSVTDASTCAAATGSFTINQPNAIAVGLMAARRMYYVMVVQPVPSRWEQLVAEQHRMLIPGQQAMEQYLQVSKIMRTSQV